MRMTGKWVIWAAKRVPSVCTYQVILGVKLYSKVPVEVGTKSILHHNYFDLKIGALRIKTGSNANSTRSSH